MTSSVTTSLLVAAGNFHIVRAVREALQDVDIKVIAAYSHRDMLAMLSQERFTAVVVDASMVDRYTGEYTLQALDRIKNPLPRIAVALDDRSEIYAERYATSKVSVLETPVLLEAVFEGLGRTLPKRKVAGGTSDLISKERLDELEMLLQISRSMSEVLDLQHVLNNVVTAAAQMTGAENAMILLPEPDATNREVLMLRAKKNVEEGQATNFRVKIEDNVVGRVYTTGEPLLNNHSTQLNTQFLANALLYVPIKLKQKTIGVLGVSNVGKIHIFAEKHKTQLINLASLAAIAIENARAHEETVRRTHELENLVRASQVMTASLSVTETFGTICEQICKILGTSHADFYHATRNSTHLVRRARYHSTIWGPLRGPKMQISGQHVHSILRTGAVSLRENNYHVVMLPIVSEERLQAIIRLFYVHKPSSGLNKTMRQEIANIALITLAQLLNTSDESRVAKRLDIIRHMTTINQQARANWSEIWLTDDKSPTCHLMTQVGSLVWEEEPFENIEAASVPAYQQALAEDIVTQYADDRESHLVIPFNYGDEYIGLIVTQINDSQHFFTPREIEVAKALAGLAAQALDNARLHSSLKESHERLKEMQNTLIESARFAAMGEMAGIVAHQINNPLTAIVVESELLKEKEPTDTERYDQLEAIHRAGKRAADYAKRLLVMSRQGEEKEPVRIDVVETLREVIGLVSTPRSRRNVNLIQKLPDETVKYPPVLAVEGHLDDVWMNLINNAYEALDTREDATITVEVRYDAPAKQIIVKVEDNGPGMPQEVASKIFQPFFTTKANGTGLGLHICHKIVKQVNGTIEVNSFLNRGTRFTVTLPVIIEKTQAIMQGDTAR